VLDVGTDGLLHPNSNPNPDPIPSPNPNVGTDGLLHPNPNPNPDPSPNPNVGTDGLLHSSQLRQRAPPAVGEVIRVVAQSVDTGRGRLSLALAT
jgi:hypothetical protein